MTLGMRLRSCRKGTAKPSPGQERVSPQVTGGVSSVWLSQPSCPPLGRASTTSGNAGASARQVVDGRDRPGHDAGNAAAAMPEGHRQSPPGQERVSPQVTGGVSSVWLSQPSCPPSGRASTTCGTLLRAQGKPWMAGPGPAMTWKRRPRRDAHDLRDVAASARQDVDGRARPGHDTEEAFTKRRPRTDVHEAASTKWRRCRPPLRVPPPVAALCQSSPLRVTPPHTACGRSTLSIAGG
jgi:hypothetical protein